ncbi:MAG TPA: serine hydrolase domain-containing protein [Thermoanaerobaculia bacterium]|jgi:CubicO group peptidase (beta-lactamase class C family)|nr:serine hydrolase domain-containing protein [Thermoanaerobaculia bacterium]
MRKLLLLLAFALPLAAQWTDVDAAVHEILAKTGAPSASIAIVKDGKIAYEQAYGLARVDPKTPATPAMRYSIGSVSKQFTAAAILLLAEEGKLSLDDRVVRWLPELTRAKDVSIRHLLTMTSGYRDYWPQDYVMPMMLNDVQPTEILEQWAERPLDFEPGTKRQYSNTNYIIAGVIIERVSGMPLMQFLGARIFTPLAMKSVFDTDQSALGPEDAMRYERFALGPPRVPPKEGKGWLFAAGGLAMTAHDLALWNISVMDQSVLQPASYRELTREMQLANGIGVRYGLGVGVSMADDHRMLSHGGEVSGFTSTNQIFVDDRGAISVLVNLVASDASGEIATKIRKLVFPPPIGPSTEAQAVARRIFEELQRGRIDRSLFTANANAYFSEQAVKDFGASLGSFGKVREITEETPYLRGGMVGRTFKVKTAKKTFGISTFWTETGRLEQYIVTAE